MQERLQWVFDLKDQISGPMKDIVGGGKALVDQQKQIKTAIGGPIKDYLKGQRKMREELGYTNKDIFSSSIKRASLIRQEQQDLRELKRRRKAASSIREIEAYNNKIEETRRRISTLKGATGGLQGVVGRLNKSMGGLLGPIAGVFAISRVKGFVDSSIQAFDVQDKAEAQLRASLKSTAGVAGKTFEEVTKSAAELQKVTLFGDEEIIKAQSVLLTFTNITGKSFDEATEAVLNLSTKFDQDLKSSAVQLGKALNDPILGITALSRTGIQFSNEQRDSIKRLVEAGQMQAAQQIIIAELNMQMGNSAREAAQTGMGPWQQMQMMFGDFKEQIGAVALSLLKDLRPTFEGILNRLLEWGQWLKDNPEKVRGFVKSIGKLAAIIVTLTVVVKLMTIAQLALNLAMTANPIGIIIVAIGALIVAVSALIIYWEEVVAWLKKFGHWLLVILGPLGMIVAAVIEFWDEIKAFFNKVANAILDFIDWILPGAKEKILSWVESIKQFFSDLWDSIKEVWKGIKEFFGFETEETSIEVTVNQNIVESGMTQEEWVKSWDAAGEEARKSLLDKFNRVYGTDYSMDQAKKLIKEAKEAQALGMTVQQYRSSQKGNGRNPITAGLGGVAEVGNGRDVRNNNIRIEKLVERIEIKVPDVKMSAGEIKKLIERTLIDAVRDTEIALS